VSQTWRRFGSPGQHFCDRLSAAADGAFAGPPLPRSAYRQIHLQPPVRRSLFDFDHASQKLPKYGHGAGFEIEHWLFQKLSNIEQRLRDPEEHAGSITAPLRHLPVTESVALQPEPRVETMTYHLAAIPLLAIQRLRCPKCRTRMVFARISPGPTGFELRTFDCPKCDHIEKIAIASDPMKSGDVGWLVGELRPPA
jgi:hypothetical protein